jgi:hypothetical protein
MLRMEYGQSSDRANVFPTRQATITGIFARPVGRRAEARQPADGNWQSGVVPPTIANFLTGGIT